MPGESIPHAMALRKTPVPSYVKLVTTREDATWPKVAYRHYGAEQESAGAWQASVYLVRKNGLPIFWPTSANRPRRTLFVASFVVDLDPLVNMRRLENVTIALRTYAKRKLQQRQAGLKSAETRRLRGNQARGPGRPRGILRSMEKTGSNRGRRCVRCDGGHHPLQKCRTGESR